MLVREGMSSGIVTVGLGHTLRDAARKMTENNVGAAVIIDPDLPAPRSSPSATCCAPTAPARTWTPSW